VISIDIRTNFRDVARQMDRMAADVANKVMARALNKTVDQGKKEMARSISQEFMVTRKQANDRLRVQRASTRGSMQVSVSLSASRAAGKRSMNLIHFVEKSISLSQARKRMKAGEGGSQRLRSGGVTQKALAVRVKVKRGGKAKILEGAFIATNKRTGGTAVFMRQGKDRMPIEAKSTIDIPSMFNTRRINEAVRRVMLQRFEANFQRELRTVQQGWNRR